MKFKIGDMCFLPARVNHCKVIRYNDTHYTVRWTEGIPKESRRPIKDFDEIYIKDVEYYTKLWNDQLKEVINETR